MVSALRNAKTLPPERMPLEYELKELKEFDRVTDEAAAVRSVFGPPIADLSNRDNSLPLVIIGYDKQKILQHLTRYRESSEHCLRPIAVIGVADHAIDPVLEQLADGLLPPRPDSEQLNEMAVTLSMLQRQLRDIRHANNDRPLSLLQFLYTRGSRLQPVVDPNESHAYSYPLAELMLGSSAAAVRDMLDDMANHQIVSRAHVDRLFTCPDCNNYRVCVKELCPECHSTHLETEESIHHFRCGHVGPESEYMISGRPVCPKCNGEVLHIGVEYNRPGQFVNCGDCHYWATEPLIEAWCAVCNRYHSPANLLPINISNYSLTQSAMHIARTGSWNPRATLDDQSVGSGHHSDPPHSRDDSIRPEPRGKTRGKNGKSQTRKPTSGAREAIASVILKIAGENDKPTTVYNVALRDEDGEWESQMNTVREIIQERASESLMCVELRDRELLVVLHDAPERGTPTCRQLENAVRREAGIAVDISELEEYPHNTIGNQTQRRQPSA